MRYEKRSLLCLTFLYVLQTEEGGGSGPVVEAGNGNFVAVLGPAKKKINMVRYVIIGHLNKKY